MRSASKAQSIEYYLDKYGDLLYDLSSSILTSPSKAKSTLRTILKKLLSAKDLHKNSTHERGWVLRVACDTLMNAFSGNPGNNSSHSGIQAASPGASENRTPLDSEIDSQTRLAELGTYFQKLKIEDQLLLLLKDKHQIPYSEIATALNIPEGSLKMYRQQALRTLEDWLWNNN